MYKAIVYGMNRDSKTLKDYIPRLITHRGFQDVCEAEWENKHYAFACKMNI